MKMKMKNISMGNTQSVQQAEKVEFKNLEETYTGEKITITIVTEFSIRLSEPQLIII